MTVNSLRISGKKISKDYNILYKRCVQWFKLVNRLIKEGKISLSEDLITAMQDVLDKKYEYSTIELVILVVQINNKIKEL